MIAAVTDGRGDFAFRTLTLDRPGPEEVLIEIRASGVCRTDVELLDAGPGLILGHEGAGVVAAVGDGAAYCLGDRVLLNWARPCGECSTCRCGLPSLCGSKRSAHDGAHGELRPAFGLGTLATHALVHEAACVPLESTHHGRRPPSSAAAS